jgi:hypothetical protein
LNDGLGIGAIENSKSGCNKAFSRKLRIIGASSSKLAVFAVDLFLLSAMS